MSSQSQSAGSSSDQPPNTTTQPTTSSTLHARDVDSDDTSIVLALPATPAMAEVEAASQTYSFLASYFYPNPPPAAAFAAVAGLALVTALAGATQESIEALPKVTVTEETTAECSICLKELEVGEEAKEMPSSSNSEDYYSKTTTMSQESSNASVAVAASIGSFMEEAWMTKPFLSDEWRCCSICLECLNSEEADKEVTLPCKHKFHSACIQTWLAKRDICPLCGINVKPAVQLCRINVKLDVPAMMEENDEINVWVNMITNMAQLWHFDSL
ncbi:hypothetical protein TB2_045056 [Malus domestica]